MYRNVQRLMDDLDQDLFVRQLPTWKTERKLRESGRPQAEVIRFSSPAASESYEEDERWEKRARWKLRLWCREWFWPLCSWGWRFSFLP